MRHLLIGHRSELNQLMLICTDRGANYRLVSAGVLAFHTILNLPFLMSSIVFLCVISHNLLIFIVCFLCMCRLLRLLPTSGENFMSITPLEIYLLRKMVTCSILVLPVCMFQFHDMTSSTHSVYVVQYE